MNENLIPIAFANAEEDSFIITGEQDGAAYNCPTTYKNSVSMPCYISYNEDTGTYSITLPRNTAGGTYTPIETAADNTSDLFGGSGHASNLTPDNNIENALIYGVAPA